MRLRSCKQTESRSLAAAFRRFGPVSVSSSVKKTGPAGSDSATGRVSGFTLLEVLVVLAIIGSIVAIAVPRFGNVFETNIKGSIRRFTGAVKFCFHESVIKQTVIRLNIDPVLGEYWPSILATSGSVGEFVSLDQTVIKRAQLPDGIRFVDIKTPHDSFKKEDDAAFITFYPSGYAEKTVIHMADTLGHSYSLLLQPLTGDLEIMDGYVDLVEINSTGPFGQSGSTF
jgi:general secretion pathway protein H